MSRRTERVASTIQQELATIIMRELNDPRLTGLPSITRVKVSEDLSIADIFMSIMGSEGQQNAAINALRHSAGLLRLKLTKQLTLRTAPFLKFHIDENLKREMNVLQLLQKVRQENEESERRAQAKATGTLPESGEGSIAEASREKSREESQEDSQEKSRESPPDKHLSPN
jgi:ribosome-binding factor A